MCGRFTQQTPQHRAREIFDAEDLADDPGGRFNVAPTDEAAVVVQREDRRAVVRYRWGLIPHWADDPKVASRMFNARAETLATSPPFRDAFRRRRCLVPVDGFYEWLREGSRRQPMRIHDPADGRSRSRGCGRVARTPRPASGGGRSRSSRPARTGSWPRSTTGCRSSCRPTRGHAGSTRHPRTRASCGRCSSRATTSALDAYPVPTLVNNVRNDGPELVARLQPPPEPLTLL